MNKIKTLAYLKFVGLQFLMIFLFSGSILAQSYAPAPGEPGSTAMHRDSSALIGWATEATITRGYLNIQNPGLGTASYGTEADALGYPDGTAVVSLGDGGEAVLNFQSPIINGTGPDFAVFENGFADHYMEFAFVEVSSDGVNFFRFDAVSETPTDDQITNFTFSDCAYIHNLAGKYRQNYGTPFDLEELNGIVGLDVNAITHIRLIDVVGTIDPAYATYDSQGNIINDPFPTEFESGGFDLDAIGVIHSATGGLNNPDNLNVSVYPNPSSGVFTCVLEHQANYIVQDISGRIIIGGISEGKIYIDLTAYPNGVYYMSVGSKGNSSIVKLVKVE